MALMYSTCFELFSCDSVWKIRFDTNNDCARFAVIGKFDRFLALTTRFHAQSCVICRKRGTKWYRKSIMHINYVKPKKKLTFFHIANFAVSARVHKLDSNKQTNTQ